MQQGFLDNIEEMMKRMKCETINWDAIESIFNLRDSNGLREKVKNQKERTKGQRFDRDILKHRVEMYLRLKIFHHPHCSPTEDSFAETACHDLVDIMTDEIEYCLANNKLKPDGFFSWDDLTDCYGYGVY